MQLFKFKRVYHPKLGKFVYKHKGSGLIVDKIFKPLAVVLKPLAKKALKPGIEQSGKMIGEKAPRVAGKKVGITS